MRKMNRKIALILIPLILASTIALTGRTFAQPTIKIGVIGPVGLPHWEPAGMKDAAELAAQEINAAGGINVGGTMYQIQLLFENEWAIDPDTGKPNPEKAVVAVTNLLQAGAQFIIGGFRTEVTDPIIETVMDWNTDHTPVLFFIDGASTDYLIRNLTIPENYTRYKWLFRNMPINSTSLLYTYTAYMKYYLIPQKLLKMYGHPVKFAVLLEDLDWTKPMEPLLTIPAYYNYFLGPNVTLVYYDRVPETATDFSYYLNNVNATGARLLIFVFSGRPGNPLIKQWREWQEVGVPALPVGINVLGQLQSHWILTGGKCEYEVVMNWLGTRTPIVPGYSEVFWDKFCAYTEAKYAGTPNQPPPGGWWPIYTANGAWESIFALKEALEAVDTLNPATIVSYLETSQRVAATGLVQYTKDHDIYVTDFGPTWPVIGSQPYGRTRGFMIQWIAGKMEIVSPIDKTYSKKTQIPPWMYELAMWDLNFDGIIDIEDIYTAALAYGTIPGMPGWYLEADINGDAIVDIEDIYGIALNYGRTAPQWPLP
jgi:branched-chain amino acid transport system substrate-binding protein